MFENLVLNIEFLIDDVGGDLMNINATAHQYYHMGKTIQT